MMFFNLFKSGNESKDEEITDMLSQFFIPENLNLEDHARLHYGAIRVFDRNTQLVCLHGTAINKVSGFLEFTNLELSPSTVGSKTLKLLFKSLQKVCKEQLNVEGVLFIGPANDDYHTRFLEEVLGAIKREKHQGLMFCYDHLWYFDKPII